MGLFGNQFEKPRFTDEDLVRRAETEIDILAADLKNRNWIEVHGSLCHEELAGTSIRKKMSPEAKEKLKHVIAEAQEIFSSEKETIDKDLADDIQKALDQISSEF